MSNVQTIREKPHRDGSLHEPLPVAPCAKGAPPLPLVPPLAGRDGLDNGALVRPGLVANDLQSLPINATTATTGLEALLQGRAVGEMPARTLGQPVSLERDLTPATSVLERLNALDGATVKLPEHQGALADKLFATTQKLRAGVMLSLSDGLGVYANPTTLVRRDLAEHVAGLVVTEKVENKVLANVQNGLANVASRFSPGMDVNAFVQAVLRESYLLQQDIMRDYALRMEGYNKQRRWIREQMNKARELLANLKDGDLPPDDLPYFNVDTGRVESYWDKVERDTQQNGQQDASSDRSGDTSNSPSGSFEAGNDNDQIGGDTNTTPPVVTVDEAFKAGAPVSAGATPEFVEKMRALSKELWCRARNDRDWKEMAEGIQDVAAGGDANQWATLADNIQNLSPNEFHVLIATLFEAQFRYEKKDKDLGATGLHSSPEGIIRFIAPHLTDAQLAEIENLGNPVYKQKFMKILLDSDPAFAATVDDRIAGFRQAREALPEAIKAMPEVADVLAQMLREGVENSSVTSLLQAKLRCLSPEQINSFATAVAAMPDGEAVLNKLFGKDYALTQPSSGDDQTLPPGDLDSSSNGLGGDQEIPPAKTPGGHTLPTNTRQLLNDYIDNLKNALETVGEDAQLGALELQEAQQRASMTLQLMSNLSKAMHDTAMAIIRNMAG